MAKVEGKKERKGTKKKDRRLVPHGVAHIQATFNNTIISIADPEGKIVSWSSAGRIGFKGSRKGTPFAAQVAAQAAGNNAKDVGLRSVDVMVKGPAAGRESAIRGLQAAGNHCKTVQDVTPIPHNACRPANPRQGYLRG